MKLGFVGFGIMGEAVVGRLLDNNYELIVYNRTRSKLEKLSHRNVTIANSPAEVASEVEIVISMVSDSKALEDVALSETGIINGIKEGSVHVDMSTVSPETTKALYSRYKLKSASFLHAPVLGSKKQAAEGELLIFAGGDKEAYEKCKEIFNVLGKRSWYFGEIEKSGNIKLIMNSFIAGMISILSQAFVFAKKANIPVDTILDILSESALNSKMYQSKGKSISSGNFEPNFYAMHMLKDINLMLEAAQAKGVPMPLLSAARELFVSACSKGYAKNDYSSVIKVLEDMAGLQGK